MADLVWDDSLNIPVTGNQALLGESAAVQDAQRRLLQGLTVAPHLLTGQISLSDPAYLRRLLRARLVQRRE